MAVDMFINMGATIRGESADTVRGPKGDIDVIAWRWGMQQSGTTHAGGGGGGGKASFNDLTVTKYVDSASAALMLALARGTHLPKVELLVRKAGQGQLPYMSIKMEEVLLTSVQTGRVGSKTRLTEKISMNFARVTFAYQPQNAQGDLEAEKLFTWNIAGNSGELA